MAPLAAPARPLLSLQIITASGLVEHCLPLAGQLSVGRGEGNDILIEDGSVSRQHALLHLDADGELRVEDLGGANGTQVQLRHGAAPRGTTESLTPLRRDSLRVTAGDRIIFGSVSAIVSRRLSRTDAKDSPIVVDPRMTKLYAELERIAGSNINVLLLGETGVGKEVVARSLHARSRRAAGPFVAINCAALPETLLEAELFGHERGAFTGAVAAQPGLFESADGGTLFLDEIGELPLATQAKLLRVLEDRKVVRVGGRTERSFDARFVAATNRDLEASAENGSFRSDLYFRLASFVLTIPPLRERSAELLSLARAFLQHASAELDRAAPELAPEALELLERYAWPGNVRELKNAMQRAAALAHGTQVFSEHLPDRVRRSSVAPKASDSAPERSEGSADDLARLRGQIGDLERLSIQEALDRCAGNQTRAAQELGISRRTLVARLDAYNLPRPRR